MAIEKVFARKEKETDTVRFNKFRMKRGRGAPRACNPAQVYELRNFLVQSLTMTKLCPSLPRHDDREEKAERRAKGRAPSQRHEACC